MSVQRDLTISSSAGFVRDLSLVSAVDPLGHAIKDLSLTSSVTAPLFVVDLTLGSSAGAYTGRGGRYRRRAGMMVTSA